MFRVHFLSATPIQTALSTHIGVPESNRVSGLRCAALRDPFAWVLSIHPAAYVCPLRREGGLLIVRWSNIVFFTWSN